MTQTPQPVRVLVVEDSATVRARIVAALGTDPGVRVVGQADNGRSAVELCERLRPDVVTMDMMLPGMSGLAATEYLMEHCPTPILVISGADERSGFVDTIAALEAGAVDVLDKPVGRDPVEDAAWDQTFLRAVRLVARIRVIRRPGRHRAQPVPDHPGGPPSPDRAADSPWTPPPRPYSLVAIGASTGGPTAVATLLQTLPTSFALPLLLVLHVHESFGAAFASWLQDATGRQVRQAEQDVPVSGLTGGAVLMAPPGRHLQLVDGVLRLTDGPERHSCRPSVDILFESLAAAPQLRTAACLLTGMGRDGAAGLLQIRSSGGLTIAQDEATSAVFGMPGEAVRLEAARYVLRIEEIGPALGRLCLPAQVEELGGTR